MLFSFLLFMHKVLDHFIKWRDLVLLRIDQTFWFRKLINELFCKLLSLICELLSLICELFSKLFSLICELFCLVFKLNSKLWNSFIFLFIFVDQLVNLFITRIKINLGVFNVRVMKIYFFFKLIYSVIGIYESPIWTGKSNNVFIFFTDFVCVKYTLENSIEPAPFIDFVHNKSEEAWYKGKFATNRLRNIRV